MHALCQALLCVAQQLAGSALFLAREFEESKASFTNLTNTALLSGNLFQVAALYRVYTHRALFSLSVLTATVLSTVSRERGGRGKQCGRGSKNLVRVSAAMLRDISQSVCGCDLRNLFRTKLLGCMRLAEVYVAMLYSWSVEHSQNAHDYLGYGTLYVVSNILLMSSAASFLALV